MGISFDVHNHFDLIYLYGFNNGLCSRDVCQMLQRVRHTKENILKYYLCISKKEMELNISKINKTIKDSISLYMPDSGKTLIIQYSFMPEWVRKNYLRTKLEQNKSLTYYHTTMRTNLERMGYKLEKYEIKTNKEINKCEITEEMIEELKEYIKLYKENIYKFEEVYEEIEIKKSNGNESSLDLAKMEYKYYTRYILLDMDKYEVEEIYKEFMTNWYNNDKIKELIKKTCIEMYYNKPENLNRLLNNESDDGIINIEKYYIGTNKVMENSMILGDIYKQLGITTGQLRELILGKLEYIEIKRKILEEYDYDKIIKLYTRYCGRNRGTNSEIKQKVQKLNSILNKNNILKLKLNEKDKNNNKKNKYHLVKIIELCLKI